MKLVYSRFVEECTRPCYARGKRAIFHRWAEFSSLLAESPLKGGPPAGRVSNVSGIVEYEDGNVDCVHPSEIKFIDSACKTIWGKRDYAAHLEGEWKSQEKHSP